MSNLNGKFNDNSEYPFAAFITNLGKYNEGSLVGEWVKFPTTAEELKKVFERIGIGAKDDFGQPYEEWFITDYDCYVDGIYDALKEFSDLNELNYLANLLVNMHPYEIRTFEAAIEIYDDADTLSGLIALAQNNYLYDLIQEVKDEEDLGRYYIDIVDCVDVPNQLKGYIDYKAYGRDVMMSETSAFTKYGYIREDGYKVPNTYNGDVNEIPEEYRILKENEHE